MAKKIELTIPKPCHEKWSAFETTDRGGFCGSCNKEVIDFSIWTEEQLKTYFKNKPSNVCGRFHDHQLKTYTFGQRKASISHWLSALLAGIIVIASRDATAQITRPSIEHSEQDSAINKVLKSQRVSTDTIPKRLTSADTVKDLEIVKYDFEAGLRLDINNSVNNTQYLLQGTVGGVVYRQPWYAPTRWWNDIADWLRE